MLVARIHGKSNLVTIGVSKSGKKVVSGKNRNLKQSAEYPIQFGLAIAALITPRDRPTSLPDWWG